MKKKFNNIPIKDEGRNTKYDIFIKYKEISLMENLMEMENDI